MGFHTLSLVACCFLSVHQLPWKVWFQWYQPIWLVYVGCIIPCVKNSFGLSFLDVIQSDWLRFTDLYFTSYVTLSVLQVRHSFPGHCFAEPHFLVSSSNFNFLQRRFSHLLPLVHLSSQHNTWLRGQYSGHAWHCQFFFDLQKKFLVSLPNKASLGCKAIELSTKSLSDKLFGLPSHNSKALVKQSNISSKIKESDEKVAKVAKQNR